MSTYPVAQLPSIGNPACGDPFCQLDICMGPESHGVKKPWYMTQRPIRDPGEIPPLPISLMKVDGWVLEKWLESDKESNLSHYCTSIQWKKPLSIPEIRSGLCDDCCEDIPEEIVAAYTMHNWNMLQKYDADMKKYGQDPYEAVPSDPQIEVYR